MTTIQKTVITATIAILAGVGIYEACQATKMRDQVQTLHQQQTPLAGQIEQLNKALTDATNKLAALSADNERLNRNTAELLKLRSEANLWRSDAKELARLQTGDPNDPAISEALSWRGRVKMLKQHLEQNPGAGIPELQMATTQDWLNAARRELKTEVDYRRAMSGLRNAMESRFANELQSALKNYLDANNKQFPTDLSLLQPYFKAPVDDAILQRYAILPKEQMPNLGMGGKWIISPKSAVDEEFDSRVGIGPDGWGTAGSHAWNDPISSAIKTLDPVMKAYAAKNSGREPTKPAELLPYIETPEQRAAYDKALKFIEASNRYDKE
ncbi:MAG: hypothetical protein H7Y43_17175 [Akkermansiaceae bacterium]|nr:hypothetical protein [Verrucomicrobiales bacterium]